KLAEGVVFHALAAYAAPRLRAAGIASADRVCGMHQTGHVDERYLLALLAALPPGVSEVYCHPAEGVAAAMAPYQQGYDHAGELAALTSARVREAVHAAGGRTPFGHDGFADRVNALSHVMTCRRSAENVASNKGHRDPASEAVRGWLESRAHRENIEGAYGLTGIGVARNAAGEVFFTQIFVGR